MDARALVPFVVLLFTHCIGAAAAAENDPPQRPPSYAEDNDVLDGDRLKLRVTVDGFIPVSGADKASRCAPKGSVLSVTHEREGKLSIRFKKVPNAGDGMFAVEETPSKSAINACTQIVNDYTQYEIDKARLMQFDFRRSGVTFGALVVPFKFYLSGERKITTSSTIAPYVGFRGPAPFGLTFTPIVSAGLGLVPVTDSRSGETETKSALSVAVGLVLTSSKNDSFNAGIMIGRDYLSRADEVADPNVRKAWFSLYAGYKL
jgi:hypothetical protein